MSAATQVAYAAYDSDFFKLPREVQQRIEAKLDDMSRRLASFQHHHLAGSNRYRLRVGDYRVIYTFDVTRETIFLLAVGHRREVYRR